MGVRALPRHVDYAVVNDERRDESRACGFSFVIEFLDAGGRLRFERLRTGEQACDAGSSQSEANRAAKPLRELTLANMTSSLLNELEPFLYGKAKLKMSLPEATATYCR
jgi:hypothetical protein